MYIKSNTHAVYIHTHMLAYIYNIMHTCIHTYIHIYVHKLIHSYTYIFTYKDQVSVSSLKLCFALIIKFQPTSYTKTEVTPDNTLTPLHSIDMNF